VAKVLGLESGLLKENDVIIIIIFEKGVYCTPSTKHLVIRRRMYLAR